MEKIDLKRFPISLEEAKALFGHLRRAWRHEELVPQPEGYISIPLDRIQLPSSPVREDLGNLEELKASIKREGVLQPIVVRPLDERWKRFEPVVGLRRLTASKELGLERIPACIRDFGDEQVAAIALEENRFRKDLTQPELLRAMLRLRERGYTLDRIAEISGVPKTEIYAYLKIPEFPEEVKQAFFSGEISFSHLRAFVGLGPKQMLKLLRRIKAEGLSKSDTELVAQAMRGRISLPGFFEPQQFMRLLGRKLEFRRGKRSLSLTVRASDESEMVEIFRKILKFEKLK